MWLGANQTAVLAFASPAHSGRQRTAFTSAQVSTLETQRKLFVKMYVYTHLCNSLNVDEMQLFPLIKPE